MAAVRELVVESLAALKDKTDTLSAPTFELDVDKLAVHEVGDLTGVTATGTLRQEWQHAGGTEMEWNPHWFDGVEKIDYWLTDHSKLPKSEVMPHLIAQSAHDNQRVKVKLDPGPIEVTADRKMSWNFHLDLKMPCIENKGQQSISCSSSLQLNSPFNSCQFKASTEVDKNKWNVEWEITQSNTTGVCMIRCNVTTRHHKQCDSMSSASLRASQPKHHRGPLLWMYIMSTLAALFTVLLSYKPWRSTFGVLLTHINSIMPEGMKNRNLQKQENEDEMHFVGCGGNNEEIIQRGSENSNLDTAENHDPYTKQELKKKIRSYEQKHWCILTNMEVKVTIVFISCSFLLAIIDLLTQH